MIEVSDRLADAIALDKSKPKKEDDEDIGGDAVDLMVSRGRPVTTSKRKK